LRKLNFSSVMSSTVLVVALVSAPGYAYAQEENQAQQFEGFNLQGYDEGGEKAWDVKGDTADIFGDTIAITNVDANRYGEQQTNLKAKTGTMNKASGDIFLKEDVVITTERGSQLTTDTLEWEKEADIVHTDDPVVITDEAFVATGTGLRAQPGLKLAQMNKDVTVNVKTDAQNDPGKVVTITCDGPMEIDQKKNMAVFQDNVVAIQDDRTLKADRMEVYFDPETHKIQETVCIGNVSILQGDNVTYSDRAVYMAATQKLTLSGSPKLIMITEDKDSMPSF